MKSNASDFLELLEAVYIDASSKCTADVWDYRDLITIRSRVEYEGLSFLTIGLPQFARFFERCLANGRIDSDSFPNFTKVRRGSVFPALLQGYTSQIFDIQTGEIKHDEYTTNGFPEDMPTLVESVRQICLLFSKVELACTQNRVQAALENFVSIEQSLSTFSASDLDTSSFVEVSSVIWDNMLVDFRPTDCIPNHGPGATADGKSGNQKYRWQFWHDRLEPYFPLVDNGFPLGIPASAEELRLVTIVPGAEEQPVKVVTVPKTLKSPRIIAIEPCCQQFVQQGIRSYLYDRIESNGLTRGHINFRDQGVNQQLAISSSIDGQLATIDLSDASDRVPRDLAMRMFRASQDLTGSIEACRSTRARLPDGRIIAPLTKFASMGSALCFPVEAMYFYTICVVALLKAHDLPLSHENVFHVSRDLYVYGDDIIVPSAHAGVVLDHLQKYNCKVNTNKTFVSGSFRESCGVDAFAGYEVTPTYVRHLRPENRQHSEQILSWVATSNLFYKKGYWRTTTLMRKTLERVIGPMPYVSEESEAIGCISYLGYRSVERWNGDLQRFEVKALVPRPIYRTDRLDGYSALMKCFLSMGAYSVGSILSKRSLEHSARRGVVALQRRWAPTH